MHLLIGFIKWISTYNWHKFVVRPLKRKERQENKLKYYDGFNFMSLSSRLALIYFHQLIFILWMIWCFYFGYSFSTLLLLSFMHLLEKLTSQFQRNTAWHISIRSTGTVGFFGHTYRFIAQRFIYRLASIVTDEKAICLKMFVISGHYFSIPFYFSLLTLNFFLTIHYSLQFGWIKMEIDIKLFDSFSVAFRRVSVSECV